MLFNQCHVRVSSTLGLHSSKHIPIKWQSRHLAMGSTCLLSTQRGHVSGHRILHFGGPGCTECRYVASQKVVALTAPSPPTITPTPMEAIINHCLHSGMPSHQARHPNYGWDPRWGICIVVKRRITCHGNGWWQLVPKAAGPAARRRVGIGRTEQADCYKMCQGWWGRLATTEGSGVSGGGYC